MGPGNVLFSPCAEYASSLNYCEYSMQYAYHVEY